MSSTEHHGTHAHKHTLTLILSPNDDAARGRDVGVTSPVEPLFGASSTLVAAAVTGELPVPRLSRGGVWAGLHAGFA